MIRADGGASAARYVHNVCSGVCDLKTTVHMGCIVHTSVLHASILYIYCIDVMQSRTTPSAFFIKHAARGPRLPRFVSRPPESLACHGHKTCDCFVLPAFCLIWPFCHGGRPFSSGRAAVDGPNNVDDSSSAIRCNGHLCTARVPDNTSHIRYINLLPFASSRSGVFRPFLLVFRLKFPCERFFVRSRLHGHCGLTDFYRNVCHVNADV